MDAFHELGIKRSLAINPDELRAQFREKGSEEHPDGGGNSERFSVIQEAFSLLARPSQRLKHWLELEGLEGEIRGSLTSELVDLFAKVGPVLQLADERIRERAGAGSALARALLEPAVQSSREQLEELMELVSRELDQRVALFPAIEAGELDGWVVARELMFLEKWEGQLKERFSALW